MMPDSCPTCVDGDLRLTSEGAIGTLRSFSKLRDQAEWAAGLLDYGFDSFNFDDLDSDPETATFEVKWEQAACRRGCCGTETKYGRVPLRYLWMPYDDVRADIVRLKAAMTEAAAEVKRKKELADKIRQAQAQVETAKLFAGMALNAAKNLSDAEASLAALRGAS